MRQNAVIFIAALLVLISATSCADAKVRQNKVKVVNEYPHDVTSYTQGLSFMYDASTFEYKSPWSYPREGWGLTTDGRSLIASDGSSRLYFMDKNFKQQKVLNVTLDGRPVNMLNELEWIDGKIWANVYMTDLILIIDPSDGKVEATVDCTGLLPPSLRDKDTDVLNGIAFNPENGKIYLTGKYWKRLYEIETVAK